MVFQILRPINGPLCTKNPEIIVVSESKHTLPGLEGVKGEWCCYSERGDRGAPDHGSASSKAVETYPPPWPVSG